MTPTTITKQITLASDIARPSTLPILSHLVIGNGKIIASDIETQITIDAPFDFAPYAVPAAKFKAILGSVDSEAQLKLDHKQEKLTIKAGRSKFGIATLPPDDFPMMDLGQALSSFEMDQANLKAMLHDVAHAVPPQNVKQILLGVCLDIVSNELNAVGCDGARLAIRSVPLGVPDVSFIVPRGSVSKLNKILTDGPITITLYEGKASFSVPGVEFITKLIVGKYPDYRRIIPKPTNKMLVDRESFIEAINRASVVLDKVRTCVIEISDTMTVTCSANGETASDDFQLSAPMPAVKLGFNPDYLREALQAIGGDEVEFGYTDDKAAITLVGNGLVCVVMPVRV